MASSELAVDAKAKKEAELALLMASVPLSREHLRGVGGPFQTD